MRRPGSLPLLAAGLLLWAAPALADTQASSSPPPAPGPTLSAEDQEVVENLELLESMEAVGDLDLLLALDEEEQQQ